MKIGEISKVTGSPISTLRYYDKLGLFLNLKKDENGIRVFTEENIAEIRMIECLKNSGMMVNDIKHFIDLCQEGDKTISERLDIFYMQEKNIKKQMAILEKSLKLIKFKQWYYEIAKKDGTVEKVKNMSITDMPQEIAEIYKETH